MHPQLPAQPNLNPNNKLVYLMQIVKNLEGETNYIGCNELWLRSWPAISHEESSIHKKTGERE
jgi:hypothetical protein